MTESEAAELAREVVRELFTNAAGWKATRLVMECERPSIERLRLVGACSDGPRDAAPSQAQQKDGDGEAEMNGPKLETYEEAVARTGRQWPYRSEAWPCPACFNAECDLDIDLAWSGYQRGILTFVYQHRQPLTPAQSPPTS